MPPARLIPAALAALLVAFVPAAARAAEGFTLGIEGGRGEWEADPAGIVEGSEGRLDLGTANAFTAPLHQLTRNGFHLHFGWNILGHAAIEAALQTTTWDLFNGARGGAGFFGGRLTWFPAQIFLPPDRPYDLGLEVGGGFSIAGGPSFGMDGTYFSYGVMAEYYPVPWFSLGIGYRVLAPSWDRFFLNYDANIDVPVKDFSPSWGTATIAFNFHLARVDRF